MFPLSTSRRAPRIHLDHARCSLLPETSLRRIVEVLEGDARDPHNRDDCVQLARQELGALLHAGADEIALTQSSTHAVNLMVNGLSWRRGDNVVVTDLCYRSIAHVLIRLAGEQGVAMRVAPTDDWRVTPESVLRVVDDRTRLVIVEHVPMWCGVIQPLPDIGAALAGSPALFAVNATQSAGQLPLDVEHLQCDFLFGTSRKWLRGPRGVGFLYIRRNRVSGLRPPTVGYPGTTWTSEGTIAITDGVDRFRVADQPYALFAGFADSVAAARARGIDAIAKGNTDLGRYLRAQLDDTGGVELYDTVVGTTGTVPFNVIGLAADDVVRALAFQGIRVCAVYAENARLSFARLGIQSLVRASAHWPNTTQDVDALAEGLELLADRAARGRASSTRPRTS